MQQANRKEDHDASAMLVVADIRIDGGTQPRSRIDEAVVADYAQALREGVSFPDVVVFYDGANNWLADGFHRWHAARSAGLTSINAQVIAGTRRDAVLYSVGANDAHGLRRTNDDKRKAVMTLLQDDEWGKWSDREIARRCAVSHSTVILHRRSLVESTSENHTAMPNRTFTTKHGTTTTMKTANIGRRNEPIERIASRPVSSAPSTVVQMPQSRGVGLGYAHKAISFLQQIPPNDGLRDEALDTVARWIDDNR